MYTFNRPVDTKRAQSYSKISALLHQSSSEHPYLHSIGRCHQYYFKCTTYLGLFAFCTLFVVLWARKEHILTQKHQLYYLRVHQNRSNRLALSAFRCITSNVIHFGDLMVCTLFVTLWTWQGHHPTQKHQLYYPRAHQIRQNRLALSASSSTTSNVMPLPHSSLYA